jgi:ligand-binding sensor domain-containing protein
MKIMNVEKSLKQMKGYILIMGIYLYLREPNDTYKIIGKLKTPGYYYNQLSKSEGQIFVSTLDGMFEIRDHELVKMPGVLGSLKGVYSYFRDSKKRFWIAKDNMGLQFIPDGDTSHFIQVVKPSIDFIPGVISEDNHGNIWAGSGRGLIRISEMEFKIFDVPSISRKKHYSKCITTANRPASNK